MQPQSERATSKGELDLSEQSSSRSHVLPLPMAKAARHIAACVDWNPELDRNVGGIRGIRLDRIQIDTHRS